LFAWVELGENMRGCATKLQGRFRGDWLHVRDAAHAICSKNSLFLRHVAY
jgi:hypothetical protein